MCYDRFRVMLAHHRGPYKQSIVIAVLALVALFVFFPPFEFKPYTLKAEKHPTVVEMIEEVKYPDPPEEIPEPVKKIEPATDGKGVDEVPTNVPGDFSEFPRTVASYQPRGFVPYDQLPEPEHLVSPTYPDLAREAGIEGAVILKVRVGVDHRVHEAVVLSSDVTPEMERAAIEAALKCRYQPARQGSVAVEVWVPIRMTFQLN